MIGGAICHQANAFNGTGRSSDSGSGQGWLERPYHFCFTQESPFEKHPIFPNYSNCEAVQHDTPDRIQLARKRAAAPSEAASRRRCVILAGARSPTFKQQQINVPR